MNNLLCQCCRRPLTVQVQQGLRDGIPDQWMIDCRHEGCKLYYVTIYKLCLEDYARHDFSEWGVPLLTNQQNTATV